jgi:hypothetical protein
MGRVLPKARSSRKFPLKSCLMNSVTYSQHRWSVYDFQTFTTGWFYNKKHENGQNSCQSS